MDLFSSNLQAMTFSDVADFLSIAAPEEGRPSEGPRIDFKLRIPDDLCDTIAALANTFGGLVFIGIESDKKKNNVPINIPGFAFVGGDVRAGLAGKIMSQVMPRPDFDIGVATIPNGSGNVVAVIRVREGVYPPYQFTSGDRIRFPVRVMDTTKTASLRDIEQMFKKREVFSETPESRVEQFGYAYLFPAYVEGTGMSSPARSSQSFQTFGLRPRQQLRIRLDQKFERKFRQQIERAFPDLTRAAQICPPLLNAGSHVFRWQSRLNSDQNESLTLVWYFECTSSGVLRYSERIDRHDSGNGESISDIFLGPLRFLRLAREFYSSLDYFGSVSAHHRIQCSADIDFLDNFPDSSGQYQTSTKIRIPGILQRPANGPEHSTIISEIESLDTLDEIALVCDSGLAHLRELRFASVDYLDLFTIVKGSFVEAGPFVV
jgi:hypothetical protein